MSGKAKFLLSSLLFGMCCFGIGWIGLLRFGMGAALSAIFLYLGYLLVDISLFLGLIFIIGFKRFIRWIYLSFVVCFVITVIFIIPFIDLITILVMSGIAIILALTLIPFFKKS